MRFLHQPQTDLTYDDVFLVPSASDVASRFQVDLTPPDPTGARIPLAAANMTAVTGERMLSAMARRGGLAVLPQDLTSAQAAEVIGRVKGSSPRLEPIPALAAQTPAGQALERAREHAHLSVAVLDDDGAAVAVAHEAALAQADAGQPLGSCAGEALVLTAAEVERAGLGPDALSTEDRVAGLSALAARLREAEAELALVLEGGALRGAVSAAGLVRASIYAPALDERGRLRVAAAIGINGDPAGRARALREAGADVLVLDTAHGHQAAMLRALEAVRAVDQEVPLVAGNVVTAGGVRDLLSAGADVAKVGVGPGAMCTTRMMTAVGRPQLSAVIECAEAAADLGGHVWADGGVKHPRDAALALAAGASQVMIGSWFAGTWESPGRLERAADGSWCKTSFGMASTRAVLERTQDIEAFERARRTMFEEGISASRMSLDPRRPSVEDLIDHLTAGIRSSMSYAGARTLPEFAQRAVVGLQSTSGYAEGREHSSSWS